MTAVKPSMRIDSVGLDVPVEHSWNRKKGGPRVEIEVVHAQIHDDAVWLWDQGCNLQSDIYTFGRGSKMFQSLADLPHVDAIYRYATEQRVANRTNLIGEHLDAAVRAMEDVIAARDGSSVYFAQADDRVKIGWSKQVSGRLAQLQTGSAHPIRLLGTVPGGRAVERRMHERFAALRISGEWFKAGPELLAYVAQEAQ